MVISGAGSVAILGTRQTCDCVPRKEREAFAQRAQIPRCAKEARSG